MSSSRLLQIYMNQSSFNHFNFEGIISRSYSFHVWSSFHLSLERTQTYTLLVEYIDNGVMNIHLSIQYFRKEPFFIHVIVQRNKNMYV